MKDSGSPSRRYTKEILCSYGYRQDLARAFATKLRDRVQERAMWQHTLLLLAMTTCFMSNQAEQHAFGISAHSLFGGYQALILREPGNEATITTCSLVRV